MILTFLIVYILFFLLEVAIYFAIKPASGKFLAIDTSVQFLEKTPFLATGDKHLDVQWLRTAMTTIQPA